MCNFVYAKESLKEQCHGNCGFHYLQFCMCKRKFKGTVPWDVWLQVFHESVSPKPLRVISNFFFIGGNICSSRCPTGVVADTGGKFTTCVIDTSGKLLCVIDTSGKLPLVSLTLAENLTPAANLTLAENLTPAANLLPYHWLWWQIYNCSAQTVTRIGLLEEIPRSGVQIPCLS